MAVLPSVFKFKPSPMIDSHSPSLVSETRGLVTRARAISGHRWEINAAGFVLPDDYGVFSAFIDSLKGRLNSFEMDLPKRYKSTATNKTVQVSAAIGATTIELTANPTNVKVGNMFTFSNHAKLYKVIAVDDVSDIITIFPPLRLAITAGNIVNFQTPRVTLRLNNNIVASDSNDIRSPIRYRLDCVEAV